MSGAVLDRELAVGRWTDVPTLGCARFAVRSLGLHRVQGTLPLKLSYVDVAAGGGPARVHAELDVAGISTGNARRDADLHKPHLLDVAACPTLVFTGTAVSGDADGWSLTGTLTGRAATDVTLDASVLRTSSTGEVTVRATGAFDRRALGIRAPRVLIGRRVDVTIEATFRRPS